MSAIAPVMIHDPDSRTVAVNLLTSGGTLRATSVSRDVEYTPASAAKGAFVSQLRLFAELEPLNAALSTLVWLADSDASSRPGGRASIRLVATDLEGASSTSVIELQGTPTNSVPQISIGPPLLSEVHEDQEWTSIFGGEASVVDDDDELVMLRASAREDAELEVHVLETRASSSRNRHAAIHVITVLNATNLSAPVVSGHFTLTVDWSQQVARQPWLLPADIDPVMTTTPIAFDAVAKIDDERRGAAGRVRRELPDVPADLTGESIEAKLRALENVYRAGIDILVSRDDYATNDPFDVDDVSYHGIRPRPTTNTGHRWRITLSGAPPALTNAPLVARPAVLQDSTLVTSSNLVPSQRPDAR